MSCKRKKKPEYILDKGRFYKGFKVRVDGELHHISDFPELFHKYEELKDKLDENQRIAFEATMAFGFTRKAYDFYRGYLARKNDKFGQKALLIANNNRQDYWQNYAELN